MSRWDTTFQASLFDLAERGLKRTVQPVQTSLLNLSSNDYLGLSKHPHLAQRAAEWAQTHGAGSGASRLVTGTLPIHAHVESRLAALKHTEAALLFASGWQANASVLAALLRMQGPPPALFFDALNHASLIHGARAAGVRPILFRHNDLNDLEQKLAAHTGPGRRMIVTESVFSMDGDHSNLAALRTLADRFDVFLYIDEAHATGVLGHNGMGLSCDITGGVDLAMGTFSKALGGFGAYVAGSRALCDWLINRASGFIHTTALPPAVLGAMDAALDLVPGMTAERSKLHSHAARLRAALAGLGIDTGGSTTQIVPAIAGSEAAALTFAAGMREAGILAVPIRPPTVPAGTARLRLAMSAALTDADITHLIEAVAAVWPRLAQAA